MIISLAPAYRVMTLEVEFSFNEMTRHNHSSRNKSRVQLQIDMYGYAQFLGMPSSSWTL